MKHISRYGKVWKDKRTGETLGRELEVSNGDNIENYTMVIAPKKNEVAENIKKKKEATKNE